MWKKWKAWRLRQWTLRTLYALDDRLLGDMGLERDNLEAQVAQMLRDDTPPSARHPVPTACRPARA